MPVEIYDDPREALRLEAVDAFHVERRAWDRLQAALADYQKAERYFRDALAAVQP